MGEINRQAHISAYRHRIMFLNAWKIHQESGRRSLIIADNEDLTIQIEIRRVLDNSEAR
jgi:hypothetical protein